MLPVFVLALSATIEVLAGLTLLAMPQVLVTLLLGSRIEGSAIPLAHVGGIALLCLGIACWPYSGVRRGRTPALIALVFYNLLVAGYLAILGIAGEFVGRLLWPVMALHAAIGFTLAIQWLRSDEATQ